MQTITDESLKIGGHLDTGHSITDFKPATGSTIAKRDNYLGSIAAEVNVDRVSREVKALVCWDLQDYIIYYGEMTAVS